jgi:hypothetical protein
MGDIDLSKARTSITQTLIVVKHQPQIGSPKTSNGRRVVALDKGTVGALRSHRQRQLQERLLIGPGWPNHDLVFSLATGAPLHPERFRRDFDRRVDRADPSADLTPRPKTHMGHVGVDAGVDPKVVQESGSGMLASL